jgi:hypothetical protein
MATGVAMARYDRSTLRGTQSSKVSTLTQTIAIAVAVVAVTPAAAQASFPGADGVIAYSVSDSAQQGIWAVNPNTGGQRQLTSGHDEAPSFSPSGNLLAFQRDTTAGSTIFVAGADGSNAKPLVSGSEPAFSPNGSQIVFVRAGGLFVTRLRPGSHVRRLTNHRGDRTPQWSSTGAIAFQRPDLRHARGRRASECCTQEELDVIPAHSRNVEEVMTAELETKMWPDWSPNGRTLAVDLCGPFLELPHVPSVVFHAGCLPAVWPPAGGKPILSGGSETPSGFSWGALGTSCPRYIPEGTDSTYFRIEPPKPQEVEPTSPSQISWQPLIRGTAQVPTATCEERPEPGVLHSAVAPISLSLGKTFCHRVGRRHHKRWKCER